ncbi:MAG: cobyrinate a,c-diamide synthase [Gammaproteobacteria bacterium]|nr:cobyrinate a,c-diamide synthase [Gammaproteobacteria bacterium]
MNDIRVCPALFVSAPASGQGKTTVTAALARHHRRHGRQVHIFKTGPDFLDPMILEQASGHPVRQLDLWMGGDEHCRRLLHEAAGQADLILIEGAMGLFDGNPSSADLATLLGVPVLAVIDGSAMAETFGALAQGLATYRADLPFAGVFANRVAGERHLRMLVGSLPPGQACLGWLCGTPELALPHRHLGIVQAGEIADLEARLDRAAADLMPADAALPAGIAFRSAADVDVPRRLAGVRIAVARDAAFSFIYRANLDLLRKLGAELAFFSPLADTAPPRADALYLPGGYPELHLERLAANEPMKRAVRAIHAAGKPIVAECGGMMYLLDELVDSTGQHAAMAGLLSGRAVMYPRLAALALQRVTLPEGELRGHTFHHSRLDCALEPIARGACPNGGTTAESVFRIGRITASYIHFYFPSQPDAAGRLFAP